MLFQSPIESQSNVCFVHTSKYAGRMMNPRPGLLYNDTGGHTARTLSTPRFCGDMKPTPRRLCALCVHNTHETTTGPAFLYFSPARPEPRRPVVVWGAVHFHINQFLTTGPRPLSCRSKARAWASAPGTLPGLGCCTSQAGTPLACTQGAGKLCMCRLARWSSQLTGQRGRSCRTAGARWCARRTRSQRGGSLVPRRLRPRRSSGL